MLAEKDRPMHADEIRAELEGKGYVFSAKDPKASVVTALIRAKQRNLVEQVAPNTFRLSAGYRERLLESNEEEANPG
ncbi:MAG: hypothetical protein GTO63_02605 [Anaerolineae bacterium]|nr:hypothetical protein [Anaerolineae bacterium]NIN93937.1 hypothetical protein [Anaerolineae bacterium]NIQ76968.1 hypothetical protein [Anaerolineae bacterium]